MATIVAYANKLSIPIAVRAGGHDFLGRSRPEQTLVLDLWDMKGVEVVDDGQVAIIGGGIIA